MIIFINGAFGVGKTTTATLLSQRLENSMIFDPEEVGMMLRAMIPEQWKADHERTGDFQDLDLWRVLTVQTIEAFKAKYDCHLIIPMTLRKPDYFETIHKGVKPLDDVVYHFCLTANEATIHSRLLQRGDLANSWGFHQTTKCLEGFEQIGNKIEIDTMVHSPEAVVERILSVIADIK